MAPSPSPSPLRATSVGCVALVLWATLALLVSVTNRLPAFQTLALTLAASSLTLAGLWRLRGAPVGAFFRGRKTEWALGLFGIFGYHAFFFVALRSAPASEANLINYLWPLLLALLSGLLPGEKLGVRPLLGCALGFVGAIQLVTPSGAGEADTPLVAYLPALGCALIWPVFSVLSKRVGAPQPLMVGWCLATAALGALLHLGFETWVEPTAPEWMALAAIGVGPAGIALWAWDVGMKQGQIRLLAALSYLEPLASTLLLVAFGRAALTGRLGLACALIMGGAFLGGFAALRKPEVVPVH